MDTKINTSTFTPNNVVYVLISGTITISILALIGWFTGLESLANIGTKFRPMAFSTSISLIILCFIFKLNATSSSNQLRKYLLYISTTIVGLFGLSTFIGQSTGLPIIPDKLFIPDLISMLGHKVGSMASITGLLVFLSALSLIANQSKYKNLVNVGTLSSAIVAFIGFVCTLFYIFGSPLVYVVDSLTLTMAFTTSLAFMLFGIASLIRNGNPSDNFNKRFNKIKDLSISVQLKLGLAAMLILTFSLGVVSYIQTYEIQDHMETLYEHPLMVRRSIGALTADILQIRIQMRGLPLVKNEDEVQEIIKNVELFDADAKMQIDHLYNRYLGPQSHIYEVESAIIQYRVIRNESIRLFRLGNQEEIVARLHPKGIAGLQIDKILSKLKVIDDFARNKGNQVYNNSKALYKSLTIQLIFLVIVILLLTLIINSILLRNIRKPLLILTDATQRFHKGDLTSRSLYDYKNEFGALSASFNTLAASTQINMELNEKAVTLAGLMLSENDAKIFFHETITALALFTKSQIAAVYLLSDDKKHYEHFDSLGGDSKAKQTFSADGFEGEFATVLTSHKIQHIKNIPEDSRFVFNTVTCALIPREIITIPIINGKEVIAIISLASIANYSHLAIQLIENILDTLSARIAGILANNKIKVYAEILGNQNAELEAQKAELAAQSAELMEQNTELEMQKNQLNEVNRLKTNFLSNMSHELRTPLNSVIALSGVLNRRLVNKIPEEERSYLEVIERNGKQLLALINDILDISRIEAGHEEIEIANFNANHLVSDIISMINQQAKDKNIELIHIDADADILINNDYVKCQHILQNLIANAVKFTDKGKVEINAKIDNNNIEFIVSDTGIGIDENHLKHIFDEFRQADGSTSRRFGGTGLGLAIAQKYANLLGGSVTVKSTLGIGSIFTLILPLQYNADNNIIEPEIVNNVKYTNNNILTLNAYSSNLSTKTILLVEDSQPAIIQIKDFLEESNYKILVASNGAEALNIINDNIPDAMVLDLMMPGIDGFEVLKTLRNVDRTAHIPVLILTAKHITKDELKFLKRNNIHQLIQKGDVNRYELLKAISTMVSPKVIAEINPNKEPQIINGKPLVLVVEDNPDNMITVKALLADDYSIIEAGDGQIGVEMTKKYKPNLILMDIALPGLDGIAALKIIRQNGELQHIPIIALTASAMTLERETILAYGFDAYIAKPIDDKIFFKTINTVLYGYQNN